MKLQLALDLITLEDALRLLRQVEEHIDIVEVGTPFLMQEGMGAVRTIRQQFPALTILADMKIMDAGKEEATMALEAGADLVTVLGVSSDVTIKAAVDAAQSAGKAAMVDMIDVPDLETRAVEAEALGADYICVHTAFDLQSIGKNPLDELRRLKQVIHRSRAAVAGGVTLSNLADILAREPEIVVVGGGITGQAHPREAAAAMRRMIQEAGR